MPKCSYCSKEYPVHEGTTVIDSVTGNPRYYCSHKCRANSEMHRKKKKWTSKSK